METEPNTTQPQPALPQNVKPKRFDSYFFTGIATIAFYGACLYVALHFIIKFW